MIKPLTTTFSVGGNGMDSLKQIQKSYDDLNKGFGKKEQNSKSSFSKMGSYANDFFEKMKAGTVKVGNGFKTMMARSALSIKSALGSAIGKGVMVAGVLGVGVGAGSIIGEYKRFDDTMLKTKAIMGATTEEYRLLREQSKELGRTTRFEASEVAEAQKYQAMAGWKVNEVLAATPAIMDLAAASGENLGNVSDIVTDSMTAFKWSAKDAAKFTDILAATATSTNTNINMLGESFKYVSPMASALGESIEDTATYLGILANNGIKSSMAGTSLNQVFSSLLNPTKDVDKMLYNLGVRLKDDNGKFVGLNKVVSDLRGGLKNLGEFDQASVLNKIFGERGGRAILTILKSSNEEFNKLSDTIKNSEGATKKMADVMNSGLGGSLDKLKSSMSGFNIELMEIMSTPLSKWLDNSAKKMDDMTKALKPAIELSMKYWEENKLGILTIATALGWLINPFYTVIAWVVILYNKFEWFRDGVDGIFKFLGFALDEFVKFTDFSVKRLISIFEPIMKIFNELKEGYEIGLSMDKNLKDFKKDLLDVDKNASWLDRFKAEKEIYDNYLNNDAELNKNLSQGLEQPAVKSGGIRNVSNNSSSNNTINIYANDTDTVRQAIEELLFENEIKGGVR